jgi:hypothetical protein
MRSTSERHGGSEDDDGQKDRGRRRAIELTTTTILIAFAGVFLICFMKGAFGGGFAIVAFHCVPHPYPPVGFNLTSTMNAAP